MMTSLPVRQAPRRMRMMAALVATALMLAGCEAELYANLSEQEANQIVAVLLANGINASKTSAGATFSVSVDKSDMLTAISMLDARGLPRTTRNSIGQVFQKSGIMSSPFEERVRYIYALGEEVAQTLSEIDGVVSARVHVVLPEEPALGQPVKPSSAAVFIKYQPGVDLDFFVPQIRRLVSSSIEGLDYAAVSVVLSEAKAIANDTNPAAPASTSVLPGLSVLTTDLSAFWTYVYTVIAGFVLLLGGLVGLAFIMLRQRGKKRTTDVAKPGDLMEPT